MAGQESELSEKDYRACIEAIEWCMSNVQELKEKHSELPLEDIDVFTGVSKKEVKNLILRLSNSAEIAWLKEQRK